MATGWLSRVLIRFSWSIRTVGRGRRRVTQRKWVPWPNLDRLLTARLRFEPLEDRVTPTTFTVVNTADSGAGSLRQAILDANAAPGADIIAFGIGSGAQIIAPTTGLPDITEAVTIDGTTQPGYAGSPLIEISGGSLVAGQNMLFLNASGNTIQGLSLTHAPSLTSAIDARSNDNQVYRNWIGIDPAGATAGNAVGVSVGGDNNRIGGTGQGNVISGNGNGITTTLSPASTIIRGNLIGTNPAGTAAVPNGIGIQVGQSSGMTVGGTAAGERNVISGNSQEGILAGFATGLTIAGNYIGTDAAGTAALPNAVGVRLINGAVATIGGPAANAGNVISGNTQQGIYFTKVITASGGNIVQGNFIGTDFAGKAAVPNGTGIQIDSGSTGSTVGGTTAAEGNVISGNAGNGILLRGAGTTANKLHGNVIGLKADQSGVLPNTNGVVIAAGASGNFVGTGTANAGNVISGNTYGVLIQDVGSSGNRVQGNQIGTNRAGDTAFGNQVGVILYSNATGNFVGTDGNGPNDATEGNLISANATGVYLQDSASNNVIAGNRIGTNAAGTAALGAQTTGVWVFNDTVDGTRIGTNADGTSDDLEGNLISGHTSAGIRIDAGDGTTIAGNFIGLNAAGTAAIPNVGGGIGLTGGSDLTTIGGTAPFTRNVISGNAVYGIALDSAGGVNTGTNIQGNYVGLNAGGTGAVGNEGDGILLQNGGATTTTVGGTTAADRNVISGNTGAGVSITGGGTTGNTVLGNYIGTDATGTVAVANATGVAISGGATGNTVGGSIAGAGNVISGNTKQGVLIASNSNKVQGNIIGLNAAGTAKLANDRGVDVGASSVLIGTDGDGVNDDTERNVISGNTTYGVIMIGGGTNRIAGNYIGTKADGTGGAVGNGSDGVFLQSVSGVVVGTDGSNDAFNANEKNVISGNGGRGVVLMGANVVAGNWIGLDVSGAVLANDYGVQVTEVGGRVGTNADGVADADERNVISGNTQVGVIIGGAATTGAVVAGNSIGTDPTGLLARPNGAYGVALISGANANTIGGTTVAGRNVIAGNVAAGVIVADAGSDNNVIIGNYLGLGADGSTALGNAYGVQLTGGVGTKVGGFTAVPGTGAGNVISGNLNSGILVNGSNNEVIRGNLIGTDATGLLDRGNLSSGVVIGNGTPHLVGGDDDDDGAIDGVVQARNVISGNTVNGVSLSAGPQNVTIQGNYIGTDITGMAALGNGTSAVNAGVSVASSYAVLIGGLTAGAGNVISGNTGAGISIFQQNVAGQTTTVQGNVIGLNAAGAAALANTSHGIVANNPLPNSVLIGGIGGRNVIGGNGGSGVVLTGLTNSAVVSGNFIGTDIGGTLALGNVGSGVTVQSGATNSTVGGTGVRAGNLISGNAQYGIHLNADASTTVQGNFIGTDVTGTLDRGNGLGGIGFSAGSNAATIGGATGAVGPLGAAGFAGNLISGNDGPGVYLAGGGTNTTIRGNLVGTDVTGTIALGNTAQGVYLGTAGNVTVGAATAAPGTAGGNVISGNGGDGIQVAATGSAPNHLIVGNLIGLDRSGTAAVPNAGAGVRVTAGDGITIGGTAAADRNVISGNTGDGVLMSNSGTTGNLVLGNTIGLDVGGALGLGNGKNGVRIDLGATGNTVGGTDPGAGNVISGNAGAGVQIRDPGTTGNTLLGNFIGTDAAGATPVPNARGVSILAGATGNTVGGTTAAARNVISGNTVQGVVLNDPGTSNNTVQGNYIGTDATGAVAISNLANGVVIRGGASANTVGGTAPGAGNVISGNNRGVHILEVGTAGNAVLGNIIGLDATGTVAVANALQGLVINQGATNNTVGGTAAGARNVIGGNVGDGVLIADAGTSGNTVAGNFIGTDAGGAVDLGNGDAGVHLAPGADGNTLGGTTAGAGNVISGNDQAGVLIESASNLVQGNYVGLNAAGTAAVGNGDSGSGAGIVLLNAASNTIGGTTPAARNVVSGNQASGVAILFAGSTGNVVAGNYVGTDATGTVGVPNEDGIAISQATGNTIGGTAAGAGNLVSGNSAQGVYLTDAGTSGNAVIGNYIGTNAAGTAALPNATGVQIDTGASGNTIGTAEYGQSVLSDGGQLGFPTGIAVAANGDIYVGVAGNSFAGMVGGVYRIDRVTGAQTLVATGGFLSSVANPPYSTINDLAFDANGDLVVTNYERGVVRVNVTTAAQTLVSDFANPAQGVAPLYGQSVAIAASGDYFLTDADGNRVLRIDPATGARTVVSSDGALSSAYGIAVEADGHLVVASAGNGQLLRIDPTTGSQAVLASGIVNPFYVTVAADRSIFLTTADDFGVIAPTVVRVDPDTGTTAVVATGVANAGRTFEGLAVESSGSVIVAEIDVNGSTLGTLYRFTPGGARNVISGNSGVGVSITDPGTTGNAVLGNYIGTNAAGDAAHGNHEGVRISGGASGNTIGGTAPGAGNVVAGSTSWSLDIYAPGSDGNVVQGNLFGLDATGTVYLPNLGGALIYDGASNNLLGGTPPAARNVFADGVQISGGTHLTTGNTISGNYIGTDKSGTNVLIDYAVDLNNFGSPAGAVNTLGGAAPGAGNLIAGTGFGVLIDAGSGFVVQGNTIGIPGSGGGIYVLFESHGNLIGGSTPGAANTITGNAGPGILIDGADGAAGNRVSRNLLYGNAGDANLQLVNGANNNTPAAVLTGALSGPTDTQVVGQITGAAANSQYTVEVFFTPNDAPETRQFLAEVTVTTDGIGTAVIDVPLGVAVGQAGYITTTLTQTVVGNTGPISAPVPLGLVIIDGQPTGPVDEGTPITLTTRAIDPGPGQRVGYAWRVTKDGADFAAGSESVFTYTPDDNGVYVVSLTVTTTTGLRQDVILPPLAVDNADPVVELVSAPAGDVPVGQPFTVRALLRDPGAADLPSVQSQYVWAVNGAPLAGPFPATLTPALSYTPAAAGPYTVTLTANDKDGGTRTLRFTLIATGSLPAVVIDVLSGGQEGTPVHARASLPAILNQDDLTFAWQATKNGSPFAAVTGKARPNFEFAPDDNGTYVVTLTVTGPGTNVTAPVRTITVANIAPQPAIGYAGPPPAAFPVGVTVHYLASATDPGSADLSTEAYQWRVTDAVTGAVVAGPTAGPAFDFTPAAAGTYLVRLTATDKDGGTGTAVAVLEVSSAPLAVTLSGPTTGNEGDLLSYSAAITAPPLGVTFGYAWEVRRNDRLLTPPSPSAPAYSFIPPDNGTYVVTVRVTGSDGSGATISRTVQVNNVPPAVVLNAPAGSYLEGSAYAFTTTVTDPAGTNDPISYRWLVNGVAQPNQAGPAFTFTPPDNGSFVVQVQTKDDDMPAFGTAPPSAAAFTLPVQNVAPTVVVGSAADANGNPTYPADEAGFEFHLRANVTDPAAPNDPPTYQWSVSYTNPLNVTRTYTRTLPNPDPMSPDGRPTFSFSRVEAGTYIVSVTVNDGDGGITTRTTRLIAGDDNPNAIVVQPTDKPAGVDAVIVFALGGDDVVDASGVSFPVVLDGGAGNDTVTGGSGDDLILGGAGTDCLTGAAGNDTIVTQHGDDSVYSGLGDDSVVVDLGSDAYLSEVGGGGQDTIDLSGTQYAVTLDLNLSDPNAPVRQTDANGNGITLAGGFEAVKGSEFGDKLTAAGGTTLFGGGGGDELVVPPAASNVTVFGGDGADLARIAGSNVTVFGEAGDDTVALTAGSNITVFGGDGNDSVVASGAGLSAVTVFGGAGNDDLEVTAGSNITVFGGSDDDILKVLGGSNVTVFGGDGVAQGDLASGLITQFGGSGNDQITVDGGATLVTVFGGDGNDQIDIASGSQITVFGDAGNDAVTVGAGAGSGITVFGGDGIDAVSVLGGANVTVFGDAGADQVSVSGGSGVTVFGGDGTDALSVTGGSNVTVFGGLDDDAITVGGAATNVTVFGGDGADQIALSAAAGDVTVFGDAGNDAVDLTAGSHVTVFGGADDDTITVRPGAGTDITVFGGDGADRVDVQSGSRVTVFGGAGNDAVTVGAAAGTDITVFGGDGLDLTTVQGGSHVTVFGGAADDTVGVLGGSDVTVFGDAGNDQVTVGAGAGSNVTVFGGDGVDAVSVLGGTNVTVFGDAGNDTIGVAGGTNVTVFGLADDDALSVTGGSAVTVFGGDGKDAVDVLGGSDVTVFGDAGNDTLTVGATAGSNVTVFGGADDDTVNVLGGTAVTVFGGDGADAIDVAGGSQVTVFGGVGGDAVTVGAGTDVTVFGGANDDAVGVTGGTNVTVFGNDGNDILSAAGGTNVTVFGGADNDAITTTAAVTVFGGDGNDTLDVAAGSNVTVFGDAGDDQIAVGPAVGTDITVFGGDGADRLDIAGGTRVTVFGGANDDQITVGPAAGSDITVFGGDGNDAVQVLGGTNVTVFGEAGNDAVTAADVAGGHVTVFGGAGDDVASVTAGSDVTVFGESGADTLSVSTSGSNVTVFGGSGNDVLSATDGTNVTLLGDRGNDTLTVTGVSNVNAFGGTGNDTLVASGGVDISLFGDDGDDLYRAVAVALAPTRVRFKEILTLGKDNDPAQKTTDGDIDGTSQTDRPATGTETIDLSAFYAAVFDLNVLGSDADPLAGWQTVSAQGGSQATIILHGLFENVIGTAGPDRLLGNALNNWLVGNAGDDTLVGNAGDDTLEGGAGNDVLDGGAGSDAYRFAADTLAAGRLPGGDVDDPPVAAGNLGTDTIAGEAASADSDALDFGRLAGSVSVDLGSTAPQVVSSVGLAFTLSSGTALENVIGSAGNDTVVGNSRDNVLEGGPGDDSLKGLAGSDTYVFAGDDLGADTLDEQYVPNHDTLDFGQFKGGITLDLNQSGIQTFAGTGTAVVLTDPRAFDNVIGSSFADRIIGNAADNVLIGGGGRDYLDGRGGADTLRGGSGQVIYLDFTTAADRAGVWAYDAAQQAAILAAVQADFAPFGYVVTLTRPAGGPYITIVENDGQAGGSAEEVDFRNVRLDGTGSVFAYGLQDELARDLAAAGKPVPTDVAGWTPYIVGLTITVTAHEIGHFVGLRHGDAYGAITAGVNSAAQAAKYLPSLPGTLTAAAETAHHIMASPASVGSTLSDAADPTYFGAREAVKLAFNDTGTTIREPNPGYNQHGSAATAVPLGTLPGLYVPNTFPAGHPLAGQTFSVRAEAVVGSIVRPANGTSENDFYSFTATAGDAFHFEVNSYALARVRNPIDSVLRLFDANGNVIPLYGVDTQTYQDDEFETPDAVVVDWTAPAGGTYYLEVDTYTPDGVKDFDTGDYELFLYSWKVGPNLGLGDTLVTDRPGEAADETGPRFVVSGPAMVDQGQPVTLSVGITGPAPATAPTYDWVVAGPGANLTFGNVPSVSFTGYRPGTYTATLTVTTAGGGVTVVTYPVAVADVAPVPVIGSVAGPLTEGAAVTVSGSATDAGGPTDVAGLSWAVTRGAATVATGSGGSITFTPTDNGDYTIALTATDVDGLSATVTRTVTITNVAPTVAGISGPTVIPVGVTGTYSLTGVADPSSADAAGLHYSFALTAAGLATTYAAASATNSFATAFAAPSTYTVYARVYDKDGGISPTQTLTVTTGTPGAATLIGPDLYVYGTTGNDTIIVDKQSNQSRVRINGVTVGLFKPAGKIVVYGFDGNDSVTVDSAVTTPTQLYGGTGNDSLYGGSGDDSLYGGDGNDYLSGGTGTNTLDGGLGFADTLLGGPGTDTLTDPDGVAQASGGDGTDTISVTFAAGWTLSGSAKLPAGAISGGAGTDTITVTVNNPAMELLGVNGDDGTDTIELHGTWTKVTVNGGAGSDTARIPAAVPNSAFVLNGVEVVIRT